LESGLVVDYGLVSINVISTDTDGDGVPNAADNCTQLPNPGQCDSDGDGYGNRCDGDLTGNGATNSQDAIVVRQQLGKPSVGPTYNAADLNCSGSVNAQDVTFLRQLLGKPPGPSGLAP
ncbi:MAG: dockerin type I domain-containing protein, partial [Gammaproteobacteria bacterium]|nr:dockerin type I domain-containing protein [Gammaproteobacteria bacterium]